MYESFAAMKMADGLYTSSGYHVMMCAEAPVVARWSNGRIDPDQSYMLVHEQRNSNEEIKQGNGVTMRLLGTVNKKYTFKELLNKGYVPFTIKELIGEEPVEAGEAYIGRQDAPIENGADMILEDIMTKSLFCNYAICTIEAQVRDANGNVLLQEYYPTQTTPHTFHANLSNSDFEEAAAGLANGTNTVHILVRLSTGELKEAFTTTLKVG